MKDVRLKGPYKLLHVREPQRLITIRSAVESLSYCQRHITLPKNDLLIPTGPRGS